MVPQPTEKSLKHVSHGVHDGVGIPAKVAYAIFEARENELGIRMCVYSGISEKGRSSINAAERIIELICNQERTPTSSLVFYDLQTHRSYSRKYPGIYEFDRVDLNPDIDDIVVEGWVGVACPFAVYNTFRSLIGEYWTAEQIISKTNPKGGNAYVQQGYTDAQIAEELEWARGHLRKQAGYEAEVLRRLEGHIFTPAQAKAKGYWFNPRRHRTEEPHVPETDREIIVDLEGSHLRGQYCGDIVTALNKPERFSYWEKDRS